MNDSTGTDAVVTRPPSRPAAATLVHFATLVVGAALLAVLARGQWFFFDEWNFLVADDHLFESHNGHWSTVPILITDAICSVVGLDSYWPYWIMVLVAHLTLTHLLWRIMVRSGVRVGVATAAASVMLLLGAGADNIFWAFQMGFVGAAAFALGAVLLVMGERMTPTRIIAVAVLVLLGAATSGTAIPVAVAAGLVSLRRHGLLRTALAFAPPAIVYGIWYLVEARSDVNPYRADGIVDLLVGVPQTIGHALTDGLGSAIPIAGLGVVVVFAAIGWITISARNVVDPDRMAPYALFAGAVVFTALTAFSRLQLGFAEAASGRYAYLIIALTLPLFAVIGTWVAARGRASFVAVIAIAAVLLGYNTGLLVSGERTQATREQTSRGQIYAALQFALEHPDRVADDDRPDPWLASALTMGDLLRMHDRGWIDVGAFTGVEKLKALTEIAVDVEPVAGAIDCANSDTSELVLPTGTRVTVEVPESTQLQLTAFTTATTGTARVLDSLGGGYQISNDSGYDVRISGLTRATETCTMETHE